MRNILAVEAEILRIIRRGSSEVTIFIIALYEIAFLVTFKSSFCSNPVIAICGIVASRKASDYSFCLH